MIDLKDCIVPIGMGTKPPPPPRRRKRTLRKCSTCSNKECRARGTVCDWVHCREWRERDG